MAIKTGMVPSGLIRVNNDVKHNNPNDIVSVMIVKV
jgi:hypothetical protein